MGVGAGLLGHGAVPGRGQRLLVKSQHALGSAAHAGWRVQQQFRVSRANGHVSSALKTNAASCV